MISFTFSLPISLLFITNYYTKHETTHKEKKRFAVSKVIQNWYPYQLANRQYPKSYFKDNISCSYNRNWYYLFFKIFNWISIEFIELNKSIISILSTNKLLKKRYSYSYHKRTKKLIIINPISFVCNCFIWTQLTIAIYI